MGVAAGNLLDEKKRDIHGSISAPLMIRINRLGEKQKNSQTLRKFPVLAMAHIIADIIRVWIPIDVLLRIWLRGCAKCK